MSFFFKQCLKKAGTLPKGHSLEIKVSLVFHSKKAYLDNHDDKQDDCNDGLVDEDREGSSGKAVEACAGAPLAPG